MKTVKTRHILVIFFLVGISMNISCGVEELIDELDGSCDETWTVQVKPELDVLNEAASIFVNNPTVVNCENFRTAALKYVDAMEEAEGCVLSEQKQSFDVALDEAKAELQKNNCSEL